MRRMDWSLLLRESDYIMTLSLQYSFRLDNLAVDLYDLWLAGQETTSTTLTWACACLLNYPDVVLKAREELEHVTGGHRSLSLNDRKATPYLSAVISVS